MMNKRISSERVCLTRPAQNDMKVFLQSVANSHALHHPWVYPPDTEEKYVAYLERTNKESQESFFIRDNQTEQITGVVNINNIVRGAFQSGCLGFYAVSGFEERGLMGEGLLLVMRHAFDTLGLHRLEANVQPENEKSIALVKKCGFRHEGFSPRYLKINGVWKDHERFAITAEEVNIENNT